jgi:cytochrome c-type biogenesis protein CcmH/NrfG
MVLGELGRYQDALDSYDKALELDSENVDVWYGKGLIFQRWGCMGMLWSFM